MSFQKHSNDRCFRITWTLLNPKIIKHFQAKFYDEMAYEGNIMRQPSRLLSQKPRKFQSDSTTKGEKTNRNDWRKNLRAKGRSVYKELKTGRS